MVDVTGRVAKIAESVLLAEPEFRGARGLTRSAAPTPFGELGPGHFVWPGCTQWLITTTACAGRSNG